MTDQTQPGEAIRAIALGVCEAIDAHPWVGTQLSREPWQPAMVQILESIGSHLDGLGVPERAQFDSATALLSYILGLAAQYAAGARLLTAVTARWTEHDPAQYPFVRQVAAQLREHDDRQQFLAGIDITLAGVTKVR